MMTSNTSEIIMETYDIMYTMITHSGSLKSDEISQPRSNVQNDPVHSCATFRIQFSCNIHMTFWMFVK